MAAGAREEKRERRGRGQTRVENRQTARRKQRARAAKLQTEIRKKAGKS
jgi:hypothetical protein